MSVDSDFIEEARRQEDAVERLTVEPCTVCACGSCMADRAAYTDWMAKVADSLIVLTDRQRAERIHCHPMTQALIAERNRRQRLSLAVSDFLAGNPTTSREALAWVLNSVMGEVP